MEMILNNFFCFSITIYENLLDIYCFELYLFLFNIVSFDYYYYDLVFYFIESL